MFVCVWARCTLVKWHCLIHGQVSLWFCKHYMFIPDVIDGSDQLSIVITSVYKRNLMVLMLSPIHPYSQLIPGQVIGWNLQESSSLLKSFEEATLQLRFEVLHRYIACFGIPHLGSGNHNQSHSPESMQLVFCLRIEFIDASLMHRCWIAGA